MLGSQKISAPLPGYDLHCLKLVMIKESQVTDKFKVWWIRVGVPIVDVEIIIQIDVRCLVVKVIGS
jgi:hypothetical protein